MPTQNINIPSQFVVQTAAQWAADATVYSAKRILITSDAFYGLTDQRRIKIADGGQTWANLDYFPAVELSAILALVLAGFSAGTNLTVLATDTLAIALAKFQGQINARATLSSPTFTGTPNAPTAAPGNNSTQIATTAYADAAVALAVTGLLDFKGSTDCSANPDYPVGLKGDAYVVSVAGKIGGAAGKAVDVGDMYVASADNAGGTEAVVGTSWFVLEHNLQGALLSANNLSDVANAQTSRNNILPSKVGNTLKVLRVNAGETDYEVATLSTGGYTYAATSATPYAASSGEFIDVDASGGNKVVTPPASGFFAVRMANGSGSNTVTITGLDIFYIIGDVVGYIWNGAAFVKTSEKIQPHQGIITRAAAQSITNGVTTAIAFDTSVWDRGVITDIANDRIVIRRAGLYDISGSCTLNTFAVGNQYQFIIKINGTDRYLSGISTGGSQTSNIPFATAINLAAGDLITTAIYQNNSTQNTRTDLVSYLTAFESR